jgi:hypothetical protein
MHPLFAKEDRLSAEVIGAPTLMHRMMGPGLLESKTRRTRIAYSTTTISLVAKDNRAHSASCYLLPRSIYPRLGSAPTHAALLCVSFHLRSDRE